ncbi:glutathione s-transferase [Trichoderma arundinaceum]|uniref:Glutathione s-transferase n=1 Tax=Trichoderma arundinaceum TaxID=490622 RepID=A0A395NHQ8_TRIAR|nr:glutathione s-transferase [Trichoderma arundinaceum]
MPTTHPNLSNSHAQNCLWEQLFVQLPPCASQIRSAQTRYLGGAALFASLSDAAGPSNATSSVASGGPAAHNKAEETAGRQSQTHGSGTPKRGQRRIFHGGSSFSKKKPLRASEDSAIALFKDVVSPEAKAAASESPPLGELDIAAKIKDLSVKKMDVLKRLQIFRESIWPHLKEFRGQMPKHLLISSTQFLEKACDEIAEHGYTGHSVELSRLCSGLGKSDLDIRNQLVLNICHALLSEKRDSAGRALLIKELTGLWQHISQLRRRSQEHELLKFAFPSIQDVRRDIAEGKAIKNHIHPTTRSLAALFLQFSPDQARDIMPGLLATIAVLSDPRFVRTGTHMAMAPLLHLVAAALGGKDAATESYVSGIFDDRVRFPSTKLSEIQSYVVQQWPQAIEMLHKENAPWRSGSSSIFTSLHKQLQRAYSARDTGSVYSIWQDLKSRLEQKPGLAKQLRNNADFLDFLIFVWCAFRRPRHLQETFDLMKRLQIHPTVKTYTGMMHGWKFCKDTDRIEALWQKLAGSGMKLDSVIWTERISSLIEAGKPQAGIEALAEMLAQWKNAVQKNAPHTAVQPTIEAVNAAFKGLIQVDRKAAFDVLSWAGREQIEPNIRTYNILIRQSFRDDSPDEVQNLLKVMYQHNIEPDSATFTIILEEVIGRMGNASAADQVEAVQAVFEDIKIAGLRPNLETYGKMLYAVSSLANGTDEAIAAVLKHMREDDFKVTPHMVTILIERALSRDPPDMTAIDALLLEHGFSHVGEGDQTLWERVMSANAITGNTDRAMTVFNDLQKAGRPVTSLPCLTDLLWALLASEKRDEARRVVDVVLEYKTKDWDWEGESKDERYWRHHFWFLAEERGLLEGKEVPDVLRASLRG